MADVKPWGYAGVEGYTIEECVEAVKKDYGKVRPEVFPTLYSPNEMLGSGFGVSPIREKGGGKVGKGSGQGWKVLGRVAEAAPGSGVFNILLSLLGKKREQIRAAPQTQQGAW